MQVSVNRVSYEDAINMLESVVGEVHLGAMTIFQTSGTDGKPQVVVINELDCDSGAAVITL